MSGCPDECDGESVEVVQQGDTEMHAVIDHRRHAQRESGIVITGTTKTKAEEIAAKRRGR